ncbi:MAG: response regulator [Anaerolineales bacterium]|nr:response regulator [Anaerolineales bacterium]
MNPVIKVLCVDDNKRWQKTIEEIVDPMGYVLTFAPNAKEAIELLKRSSFHVAILDKKLDESDPENEDGLHIAHTIAGLGEGTKIIVYTAYGNIEDAREAFRKIKVWDFIGKDRPMREMTNAVKKAAEEAIVEKNRPSRMPEEILTSKGSALNQFLSNLSSANSPTAQKRSLEILAKQLLGNFRPLLSDLSDARLLLDNGSQFLLIRYWSKMHGTPIAVCFGEKNALENWIKSVESNLTLKDSLGFKDRLAGFLFQEAFPGIGGAVFELDNASLEEFESGLRINS